MLSIHLNPFSLLVFYPPLSYCLPISLTRTFSFLFIHLCLLDLSFYYVLSLCLSLILLFPSLHLSFSLPVYPLHLYPIFLLTVPLPVYPPLSGSPPLSSVLLLSSRPSSSGVQGQPIPRPAEGGPGILRLSRSGRARSQPKTYLSSKFWENVTRELYVLRGEGGRKKEREKGESWREGKKEREGG